MSTPYKASLHEVVKGVIAKLRAGHEDLLLTDKYPEADKYGVVFGFPEQGMPWTPFIIVDAMASQTEMQGAGHYAYTQHSVSVMYGFCDWRSSSTTARLEALRRAWLVRELLHEDLGLDTRVVNGYVTSMEPALTSNRGDGVFGFALAWQGLAVANLQPGGGGGGWWGVCWDG